MEKEHILKSEYGKFFIPNQIARTIKTFVPLGDKMISSSLVEKFMLLTDTQSYPLSNCLIDIL